MEVTCAVPFHKTRSCITLCVVFQTRSSVGKQLVENSLVMEVDPLVVAPPSYSPPHGA